MQFSRESNRLLLVLMSAFVVILLAAAYWAVIGPDTILQRTDNPRLVEEETRLLRGGIYDRNAIALVETDVIEAITTRIYHYPAMSSALGYFSLRYGESGAEAAFNSILRGDDLPQDLTTYFSQGILHQPQQGSDIQMTFDLAIQETLAEAMTGQRGAAVVLAVPGGEVLGMISLPTYDPNMLDEAWESLVEADGNPFFNRPLQGNYQPGGMLQTPLIAAALLDGQSLETSVIDATSPLQLDDLDLSCAVPLEARALSFRESFTFGCPRAFADLTQRLGPETVNAIFSTFTMSNPPSLSGFVVQPVGTPTSVPTQVFVTDDNFLENALGQGQLTITPLQMATIAAAIVNDGNAPQPYTLLATRPPGIIDWTAAPNLHPSTPLTTANTARQIQDMMRLAVAEGAAQNAGRPNIDIGGHAALAYSGDETQAWFIGFATLAGRRGIAIAVVLENSSDAGLASDIGGTVLEIAHESLATE